MSLVVVNPENESQTYEYGKRGRKPLWVQAGEREGLWAAPQKEGEVAAKKSARREGSMRVWQWRGEEGEKCQARCFIVSENEIGILRDSAKWFKWPISGVELKSFWVEIDEDFSDLFPVDRAGAWRFCEEKIEWVPKVSS